MTRLLLTGAGGFAGHHFLEHALTVTDWDIVCTDSFRHRGVTDRIRQVLGGGPPQWPYRTDVITHDLTAPFSPQAQAAIAGDDGLDYLIAMASESHVDRSIADPVPFAENNTAVILNTLELARALRPRAVIVISTDEVYGPAELEWHAPASGSFPPQPGDPREEYRPRAHAEWSPILPSNVYAASKAAQEALAIAYWRTYGVPVIITNTMNLIGERQHPEKFIPKTLRAVLAGEEAVIHGSSFNIGSRHYLHARNMADAVLFLLRETRPAAFPAHAAEYTDLAGWTSSRTASCPDRYNIASADRIDNLALAQLIADAAGRPLRYRFEDFHSTRPGHDAHYGLDPGKITGLGWKPPVGFAESLERTVRWTIANPEWLAGLAVAADTVFIELALGGAGSAAGAVVTWFTVRRKTSGRIGTSEADILWQQSSSMRESLMTQLDKVTEQRDRLIDAQASQVLPLMAGMVETLKQLGASVSIVIGHEEAEQARDRLLSEMVISNNAALMKVLERLDRDEVLQIQGTARPAGTRSDPPAGQGP